MSYQPRYLSSNQVGRESGGKQFDQSGKPLTSPKGAIGAAQVMPATAPEAARMAGLDWDEQKYKTDRDYNLQIGDAYMGHLIQRYKGDRSMAEAAYNAGMGRVDKAIERGGVNWAAHLPAETRKYIGMPTDNSSATTQTPSASAPASQFANQPSGAPVNRSMPVVNPSEAGSKVKTEAANVESASGVLGQVFGAIAPQLQSNAQEQTQNLEKTIAVKKAVLDETASQAEITKTAMFPIFAKKEAIFKRLEEVQNMDPISRALAGVFNKNYNRQYLERELNLADMHEQSLSSDLQRANQVQDTIMSTLNTAYTDQNSLHELIAKNLTQTMSLAQDSLQIANMQMSSTLGTIAANGQVARAVADGREDALGQITDAQTVTTLIAQAKASPDQQVMVGGVKLTQSDLMNRGIQVEQQGLQMKQLQLSIQAGDLQLQKMNEEKLVGTMSSKEVTQLAANDGVMSNGVKISSDVLSQELARRAAVTQATVNNAQLQTFGAASLQSVTSLAQFNVGISQRIKGVYSEQQFAGLARNITGQNQQLETMTKQIMSMPDGPAKDALKAQMTETASKFQAANQKTVEDTIDASTRDPDVRILQKSWIMNQPLSPDQAVRGFIQSVKLGVALPGSTNRGDFAYGTVQAMTEALKDVQNRYGGPDKLQAALKNKATAPQVEQEMTQAVARKAQQQWTHDMGNRILESIPAWAQADRHAAAMLTPGQISSAMAIGDARAIQGAAGQAQAIFGKALGPDEIKLIQQGTLPKGLNATPQQIKQFKGVLSNASTQEALRELDKGWVAGKGPRPSQALSDYMMTAGFKGRVAGVENMSRHSSLPSMLVTAVNGDGKLSATIGSYARNFAMNAQQNDQNDSDEAIRQVKVYQNDPMARARAIFTSIEGLDQHSRDRALQYISSKIPSSGGNGIGGMLGNTLSALQGGLPGETNPALTPAGTMTQNLQIQPAIDNIILSQKWPDDLESIRKKIAPVYVGHGRTVDAAVSALGGK